MLRALILTLPDQASLVEKLMASVASRRRLAALLKWGPDSRNYSDEASGSHPRDLARLSRRPHDRGNCRTPGSNSPQYQFTAEQARCLWDYQKDPEQNRSQCFGMYYLSCSDFRAFNQSALHGSSKPHHTVKPSKIRDVNFSVISASRVQCG